MKLLALDTSSLACTAGVLYDGKTCVRYAEQAREHTKLLLPMVKSVLAESGLGINDLDAIVLGNGPGSFIGLRIAASVAQGLAHGAQLKIAPVSSLAAVAFAAGADGDIVAVTGDAHMNQVYLGLYRRGGDAGVHALAPERIHGQGRIDDVADGMQVIAAGNGWRRYPALLEANRHAIGSVSDVLYPHADALLALGERAVAAGHVVPPEHVAPAYMRHKVAEKPAVAGP